MNNLKEVLKSSDYFAKPVTLMFQNNSKFSTIIGGILTILILILIGAITINLGIILVYRLMPKTNFMTLYNKDAPMLELNNNQTGFVYQFMDKDFKIFYDPTYFTFELNYFQIIHFDNGTVNNLITPIGLVPCDERKFLFINNNNNFTFDYKINSFSSGFCISNLSLYVGGAFTSKHFSNIQMELKKCDNKTMNNTCKPIKVINDKLSDGFFEFYYINTFILSDNFTHPIKSFIANYFILLDPNLHKISDMYYKQVNISSDEGIMFETYKNVTSINFDYYREQISTEISNGKVLNFFLNSSQNSLYITRYYMKLQDLSATVGGIFSLLMVIGEILIYQFNRYKMYEKIMNTLYIFDLSGDNDLNNFVRTTQNIYLNEIKDHEHLIENIKEKFSYNKSKKNFEEKIEYRTQDIIEINFQNKSSENGNDLMKKTSEILFDPGILIKKHDEGVLRSARVLSKFSQKIFNQKTESKKTVNNIAEDESIIKNIENDKINSIDFKNIFQESDEKKIPQNTEFIRTNQPLNSNWEIFDQIDKQYDNLKRRKKRQFNSRIDKDMLYLEIINKIEENQKSNQGSLKISYCDILGILFCRKCIKEYEKKNIIIEKGYDEMKKYLDYIDIIKLLQEFTKLKLTLLTSEELTLFNFISKPHISLVDHSIKNNFLHAKIFEKTKVSLKDLYDVYIEKLLKKNKTEVEERLIKYMDNDIKQTLKATHIKSRNILKEINQSGDF